MRRAGRAAFAALAAALLFARAACAQEPPADPGFVWDPLDSLYENSRQEIAAAAEKASQACGQRILVVASRRTSDETVERFVARVAEAWPDRTILFVLRRDGKAILHASPSASPMLPPATVAEFEERIHRRLFEHDFELGIANVLGDLGETLAGRPRTPWVAWKHPLTVLGGGRDTRPMPLAAGVAIACGASLLLLLFLRALWRDPKRVLAEIAVDGAQIVIGGLLDAAFSGGGGGGSGGGGSSFGGGGGSSGGGGANGSW